MSFINIPIDDKTKNQFKRIADREKIPMTELLRGFITDYIKQNKKKSA